MAQRALIIGLGSTGYDICNHIAQRIQWEQGGLERAPYLKFLVLETETPHGTGDLDQNYFHLRVDGTDYVNLINNPARYKELIDLESWWDKDALLSLQDRAITKGAGNIRMVGRLAFLFPGVCNRIRDEIQVRLDDLRRLTPAEAQLARGPLPDGSNPQISLGDDIIVYVVGTLCGGTCSGAFIDLGYLLHYAFAANGYPIQRVGLFSLPNLSYDPLRWQRRRANAFAALKELNHFMGGNDYSVQYPFHPGRPENPTRYSPFDTTYLSQPAGGDEQSFEEVKITTAQFLHNDIFNPSAAQVGARTVDDSASMFGGDKNGSPVTFYSFGMSALEIPGYLVAQGCCYKLGVEALDNFLAPRPNALQEADAFRIKSLGLSTEQIAARLLRDPSEPQGGENEGAGILTRIKEQVAAAISGAKGAGSQAGNDLAGAEERINQAFAPRLDDAAPVADSSTVSALPPHLIPRRIEANLQNLQGSYAREIDAQIQRGLRDPARGPVWCEVILGETQRYLEERTRDLTSGANAEALEKAGKSARGALSAARSRVEACASDPFVALFLGRRAALERELAVYGEAANAANRKRLDAMLFAPEKMLCERLLPLVRAMRAQITGAGAGDDTALLSQARQMHEILAAKLAKIDDAKPVLNGEALFEPHQTIDAKYGAFWNGRGPVAKNDAQSAFLQGWKRLPRVDAASGELLEPGAYFVDGTATRAAGDNLTRELEKTAEELSRSFRPVFAPLLQESVLARPEITDTALLRDVRAKSAVRLGLNRNSGLVQLTGANEIDLVFFQGAKNAAAQGGTRAHDAYSSLQLMRDGGVIMQFEESTTPQDLLMVRALGGYSLAMVSGFQPPEIEGNNFRQSFELESEKLYVHSRTGIKWQPFDGDRDQKSGKRQGLLLSAMCLSKTGLADGVLVRRSAGGFLYRPPRPLGPGREQLEMPADLREAATVLRESAGFEVCLEDEIKRLRHEKPVENLVGALRWLYENSENLGLWHTESRFSTRYETDERLENSASRGGAPAPTSATPLTSEQAFKLLREYWRNDAQVSVQLQKPFEHDFLPPDAPFVAPFPGQNPPPAASPFTPASASPPFAAAPAPVSAPAPAPVAAPAPFPVQSATPDAAPFPTMPPLPAAPFPAPTSFPAAPFPTETAPPSPAPPPLSAPSTDAASPLDFTSR